MPDKHIITKDGKWATVSDDELYHWKYIKREKKNGKWVYTYPNDKLGIKNFIDTKITGKAYEQHRREAVEEKRKVNNKMFDVDQDKIHAAQTSYERTKGPSWDDPKVIELEKEYEQLSKQSKAIKKEISEVEADYYNKSLKGKVEAKVNDVKASVSKAKDKLGVDERAEYRDTKKAYEVDKSYLIEATARSDKYSANDWAKRTAKSAKEYTDAKREYMKTPLGKVTKTAIAGKEYLNSIFARSKKKK